MTNTLPATDGTYRFPVGYEQAPQPRPELQAGNSFEPSNENPRDAEIAHALYLASLEQSAVEPAHVTDARADVHHAIDLGAPEAPHPITITPETNAQFITAAIHQARALTTQYILPMRKNAIMSLDAEANQNNPERVA